MMIQEMIPYTYFISAFPSFSFSTTVIIPNKKSLDCLCIQVTANHLQRNIVTRIKRAKYYTLIGAETADVSNNEQLVICIRWVDKDLEVHEEFGGVHPIENTKAETPFTVLKVRIVTWIFQCSLPLILMPPDHVRLFAFSFYFSFILSIQLFFNL